MEEKYYNETEPSRRIKELEQMIQKNFDDDNWYGYSATRQRNTIAAQFEYIQLVGRNFQPTYNCPN